VEDYTYLEDSENDSTGSDLGDTISGSKELRADDPEEKISFKKPKSTPLTPVTM